MYEYHVSLKKPAFTSVLELGSFSFLSPFFFVNGIYHCFLVYFVIYVVSDCTIQMTSIFFSLWSYKCELDMCLSF